MDRNLLHISYEAGILEDPWFDPTTKANKGMFKLSVSPEDAPDRPEYVELDFVKGDCVAVNGRKLTPAGVLKALNKLGGKHGIGRVDLVENRFVGMKSRGVYETPGGTILMHAHRQVESLTLDREVMHLRDSLIPKYAELVYYGFWFAPEREALQAFVDESQNFVTGTVRLKLYKGNVITCGRKSKYSLYDPHIASMEGVKSCYNQNDATGFIRLNGLRLRARATPRRAARRPEAAAGFGDSRAPSHVCSAGLPWQIPAGAHAGMPCLVQRGQKAPTLPFDSGGPGILASVPAPAGASRHQPAGPRHLRHRLPCW